MSSNHLDNNHEKSPSCLHELSTSFHFVDDPASYNEVLYGVPGDDAAKQHRTSSNDR